MGVTTEYSENKKVVIIGAGPAGLTAAYELNKLGIKSEVYEKDDIVGGISRTVDYKGYKFDIGGHRFFTKVSEVEDIWKEILGEDFLRRDRLSRIYYKGKFFYYPFKIKDALFGLGIGNSFMIVLSYIKSQLFPVKPEKTFEDWISNRFGYRLYKAFFKTYTEKVWGIPCTEITAEWAAQRIKGLSLFTALKNAFLKQDTSSRGVIKTLINSFYYPKHGPGMMWEKMRKEVENGICKVQINSGVEKINWSGNRVNSIEVLSDGENRTVDGTDFISTMPIRELVQKLSPSPSEEVLEASKNLNYRDFITVALIINKKDIFNDNWIYIHDPKVKVGRIQNFKNWSPYMVPDTEKTCLGLEYFCFENDGFWSMSDEELINLGKKELEELGFAEQLEIEDGTVVRMPKAYPVYDTGYKNSLNIIKQFLSNLSNLQLIGRNGMHKYNNQDHSMLTAILSVRNIMGDSYNLWEINADQDYHEESKHTDRIHAHAYSELASTQPLVPSTVPPINTNSYIDKAVIKAFSRLDKFAFASSVGITSALIVLIATLWLVIKSGGFSGATMVLFDNYFIGYDVSVEGAFIGAGYSLLWGFIFGWLFAYLRNVTLGFIVYREKKKLERESLGDLLDYI